MFIGVYAMYCDIFDHLNEIIGDLNEHDARVQLTSIKHVEMEVMNDNHFMHVIFEANFTLEIINVKVQK
jgi:hypothetical protein